MSAWSKKVFAFMLMVHAICYRHHAQDEFIERIKLRVVESTSYNEKSTSVSMNRMLSCPSVSIDLALLQGDVVSLYLLGKPELLNIKCMRKAFKFKAEKWRSDSKGLEA